MALEAYFSSNREDACGQVAVAPVAHHKGNAGIALARGDLLRHPAGTGGRDARKDALFARQACGANDVRAPRCCPANRSFIFLVALHLNAFGTKGIR